MNGMGKKKRYSYIKKPPSRNGWYCLGIGTAVLLATAYIIFDSVRTNGAVSMLTAAAGICAILLAFTGTVFFINSLRERDRSQTAAIIGGVMLICAIAAWAMVFWCG